MRAVVALVSLGLAACGAKGAPAEEPKALRDGPAVLPFESPGRRQGDAVVRVSTGLNSGDARINNEGRVEVAAVVGVGDGVSLGAAQSVRVVEVPEGDGAASDPKGGFEDLRLGLGWHRAPANAVRVRLLAEVSLPTRAARFDGDAARERGRIAAALGRVVGEAALWMMPSVETSRHPPRTVEGGLELGGALALGKHGFGAVRGGAFQRYTDESDQLVGFGRAQLGARGATAYIALEGEGGLRPQSYWTIGFAVGLRTAVW